MKRKPIDLAAVREARASLRRIAKEHPKLVGPPNGANRKAWESTLEATMSDERNDAQLVARMPTSLLERVDAYAAKVRKATGENVTQAEAVRLLLTSALDREGIKGKTRKGK